MTIKSDNPEFKIKGLWNGYNLYDLYKSAETPFEWHYEIFNYAKQIGITIFSTPFDETAVDLLESLDAPVYKIASFEATDLPLIEYVAKTGKPMIISTGMCSKSEVSEAVDTARSNGCENIVLLHCISSYPTPLENANISKVQTLAKTFGTEVGLSDHTLGNTASIAAVCQGAIMIEKHFTLSRKDEGPDSEFSIEPKELIDLCKKTREAWCSLGDNTFNRDDSEVANKAFRRSIYFVTDMHAGQEITSKNIKRIRPGHGLPPKHYYELLGKIVVKDIKKGTSVQWKHVK